MPLEAPYAPVKVDKVRIAFPAGVCGDLLPDPEEIPEEFWQSHNPWACIASSWFSNGLPANVEFHMKDGIDGETMFNHLRCIMGSFEPKHQHKIAGAAFLMSQWCEKIENWRQ